MTCDHKAVKRLITSIAEVLKLLESVTNSFGTKYMRPNNFASLLLYKYIYLFRLSSQMDLSWMGLQGMLTADEVSLALLFKCKQIKKGRPKMPWLVNYIWSEEFSFS